MNLTLQVHWENEWHDAGIVRFLKPENGLLGDPFFSYDTRYTVNALEYLGDFNAENLIDKTAVGVNLPCHFGGDYLAGGLKLNLAGEVLMALNTLIEGGPAPR